MIINPQDISTDTIQHINYLGRMLFSKHTYPEVISSLFSFLRELLPIEVAGIDIYRTDTEVDYYVVLEPQGEVQSGHKTANASTSSTQAYHLGKPIKSPIQSLKGIHQNMQAWSIYMPLFTMQHTCFGVLWVSGKNLHSNQAEQIMAMMSNYVSLAITQQEDLKVRNDVMNESAIVSVTDLKGNIIEVNDRFCEVSKFKREELIGKNQNIVNSGYHPKSLWKEVWATIGKGGIWRGEVRNKAKDGSIYWVDAVIAPFIGTNGRPYQYFSLRFDITQRKEMEQELLAQRNELEASEEEMRQQAEEVLAINNNLEGILKSEIDQRQALQVRDKAMNEAAIVSVTDLKGNILEINDRFCQVSKYQRKELIGKNQSIVSSHYHSKEFWKDMWATIGRGQMWRGEIRNKAKDGSIYWVDTTIVPFKDVEGRPYRYFSLRVEVTQQKASEALIMRQKEELKVSNEELTTINEQLSILNTDLKNSRAKITSSINYAQRIQQALLPSREELKKVLPFEHFVSLYPRDVVSGDFYWAANIEGHRIFALADCTGHGVPGAFMSAIGISLLERTVYAEKELSPARILTIMNARIQDMLHQDAGLERRSIGTMDGMDMAILVIDPEGKEVRFAGAKQPLFILPPQGPIELIRGTSLSVGGNIIQKVNKFEEHCIPIEQELQLYLTSDGYLDQFDYHNRKKFSRRRFKILLESVREYPMLRQADELDQALQRWKGISPQIDDISVMGIRF